MCVRDWGKGLDHGSNLRDQTRRHQIVSEKYLARWGLIKEAMAAAP